MAEVVKGNLDRAELAQLVHADTNIDKEVVQEVLTSFFRNLRKGVAISGYAELHGLGSFKLVTRAAREGLSPRGGKPYKVPKRHSVKFEAFSEFREEVEELTGLKCI